MLAAAQEIRSCLLFLLLFFSRLISLAQFKCRARRSTPQQHTHTKKITREKKTEAPRKIVDAERGPATNLV